MGVSGYLTTLTESGKDSAGMTSRLPTPPTILCNFPVTRFGAEMTQNPFLSLKCGRMRSKAFQIGSSTSSGASSMQHLREGRLEL